MKWLIKQEECASFFIYSGLATELQKQGHEVAFWYTKQKSAFDIFNGWGPDICLTQTYNMSRGELKCINERPHILVFAKSGMYGEIDDEFDHSQYEALFKTDEELKIVDSITNKDRLVLFNYSPESRKNYIMGRWLNVVPRILGFAPAADTSVFYPVEKDNRYICDLTICAGAWGYKNKTLNKYILPLCYPIGKYNIRVFGNQHWSCPQYLGSIQNDTLRKVLCSAKLGLHVSELHLQRYGYEVISRVFNTLACGTLCISDYVAALVEDFYPDINFPVATTPDEYFSLIDYYLEDGGEREKLAEELYQYTLVNHTYKNRVADIMGYIK